MVMISKDIIYKDEVIKDEWNGIEIEVKRTLSMTEYFEFVEMIMRAVFSDDGDYNPEAFDIVERIGTIAMCTNIELPKDSAEQYDLVYKTDLYDWVVERANYGQLCEARGAAQKRIKMIREDKANDIENKMNELKSMIDSINTMLESVSNGLTDDQMQSFVDFINNNNIDEKKLVSAVFDERKRRKSDDSLDKN